MGKLLLAALLLATASKEELRFVHVEEQGYADSCGYSVAGTLLGLYWGLPFDEERLLEVAFGSGAARPHKVPDRTLSVAELKILIGEAGLKSEAFRLKEEALIAATARFAPVVVHFYRPRKHFALLLAASPERLVIADPARGLRFLSWSRFRGIWSGVAVLAATANGVTCPPQRIAGAVDSADRRRDLLEAAVWR